MKKTLVALAALAATSAFAQSAVTLYGNVDFSFAPGTKITTSNNNFGEGDAAVNKVSGIGAGAAPTNFSSNAIGVMGSEDLGNGLKANFKLENGLTGNQGDGVGASSMVGGAARETWAGLSGGFGEARIGYQYTDEFSSVGLGEAGSGNLVQHLNGLAGMGRQTRHDMISYTSPAFAGGFTAVVQWGKGANKTTTTPLGEAETVTDAQRKHQAFGLKYASGPLTMAVGTRTGTSKASGVGAAAAVSLANSGITMDLIGAGDADGAQYNLQNKVKANYIAGNYDLGAAKLFAGYVTHKADGSGDIAGEAVAALQRKTKTTMLGAQFPMGALTPYVSYNKGSLKDSEDGTQTVDFKLKGLSLGTTYAMSKRTSLYAAYTTLKTTGTQTDATFSEVEKTKQTLFGLRHQF